MKTNFAQRIFMALIVLRNSGLNTDHFELMGSIKKYTKTTCSLANKLQESEPLIFKKHFGKNMKFYIVKMI